MRRFMWFLLIPLACGYADVASTPEAPEPPIPVVKPEYVVLRPVRTDRATTSDSAVLGGQKFYFDAQERLLDLTHLDLRSASVELPVDTSGKYAVLVRTTAEGNKILHDWTRANVGHQLGVFLDGELIDAPKIISPIEWIVALGTDLTKNEAEAVVVRLRRGGA